MRVDGIFLEVKPLLSSGLWPGHRVQDTLRREGLSVTDVSREDFLSVRKGTGGRIGISFSESNNFILSVWRIAIRRAEPGDLQIGESTSDSWTTLLGSGSVF